MKNTFCDLKFHGIIETLWATTLKESISRKQHGPNFFKCTNVATLAFGLATKAKGLQGCGPRGSPGVTSHIPRSVGKCEGVNPHIPKGNSHFGR